MDKYQRCLMDTSRSYIAYINDKEKNVVKCYADDKITIKQDEDITVKGYVLYVANKSIERVLAIKASKEIVFKTEHDELGSSPKSGDQNRFYLPLSFDDKIESIRIVFVNNLADDLVIPVEYIEADKEKYYSKIEKVKKDDLLAKAQIKHSTGNDLVNIYFQPCCEDYDNTTIILYWGEQLMAKYKVDKEVFFKSISGLAYGTYYYELIQCNANGDELLHTEKIKFIISRPNYSGRPCNVIS